MMAQRRKQPATVKVLKEGKVLPPSGARHRMVVLKGGQEFDPSDPLVKKHPEWFEDRVLAADAVEQATAGPGELRALSTKKARGSVIKAADPSPDVSADEPDNGDDDEGGV